MSIYDSIGGAAAVSAAVDELHRRVLGDPELVGYVTGVDIEFARTRRQGRRYQANQSRLDGEK